MANRKLCYPRYNWKAIDPLLKTMPLDDISAEHLVPRRALLVRRYKLGLTDHGMLANAPQSLIDEMPYWTDTYLAEKYGVTVPSIANKRRKLGIKKIFPLKGKVLSENRWRKWTDEELVSLQTLTNIEVHKKHKIHYLSIYAARKMYGFPEKELYLASNQGLSALLAHTAGDFLAAIIDGYSRLSGSALSIAEIAAETHIPLETINCWLDDGSNPMPEHFMNHIFNTYRYKLLVKAD